jgi:hypothetical protein
MYQQLWGYKVEEKLYLGVREQKRLNTTVLENRWTNVDEILYGYYAAGSHLQFYSNNIEDARLVILERH